MKTILTLFIFLSVFPLNTFAEDVSYITLEGSAWPVRGVSFSPDGRTLASGSGDSTIRLWDVRTGRELQTLRGHRNWINNVSFSPDGRTLASSSNDDTIRLWDVRTGRELQTLRGHTHYLIRVSFSPDGRTLVSSGGGDLTVRLWDVVTGQQQVLTGHKDWVYSISFSPDGRTLASSDAGGAIHLWDVRSCQHLQTLTRHTQGVSSVSFSPDGRTLASGSGDQTIRLWNVVTGQQQVLTGHTAEVYSVSFSPDGLTLASGSGDQTIRLWDVVTGQQRQVLTGHTDVVTSVSFSPDGLTLASGSDDHTIRLWALPSTRVGITPDLVESPSVGKQFAINVSITDGEDISGYQLTVEFDATTLRYVEGANGDYLPPGTFSGPPTVERDRVTLGAVSSTGAVNGDGTLATLTFEILDVRESTLALSDVILIKSDGGEYSPLFSTGGRVIRPTLSSSAIVSVIPSRVLSPAIRQQLVFDVGIAGGKNMVDHQLTWEYDKIALKFISSSWGNYIANGVGNDDGVLFTGTFEVLSVRDSTVNVSGHFISQDGFRYIPTVESAQVIAPLLGDVNRDGVVNILDLVLVASNFGQRVDVEGNPADVNEDGIVSIIDLVRVAGALGNGAAAPSAWNLDLKAAPTRADVQQWLSEARQLNLTDATAQRGILFLEQLLAALTPKETALLPNYPNPFNPETWIPYQLAAPADVTLTIYAVDGAVVRTLALGHQPVGMYQDKSRAAYWDGRNAAGEPVASGIYFYTFTAGEFTATRKMLIRK